jgi:lipid-A-disaccharide synthase
LVVAGEVSGDMQASLLIGELQRRIPHFRVAAVGGGQMAATGAEMVAYTTHMGTVGLTEGIKFYPAFLKVKLRIRRLLKTNPPDLVILVDCRDFNLRVAKLARQHGIPTVYYIAPPIWAWTDWKAKWMARNIDHVIAIFPFEVEHYRKAGARVSFVGYPLLDAVGSTGEPRQACRSLGINPDLPLVGLLPGSRGHEIRAHLPAMLEVAGRLRERFPGLQFYVPVADTVFEPLIKSLIRRASVPVALVLHQRHELMQAFRLVITASGTATLEAAILGTPMIIVYRTSSVTYALGKLILKVPHVGLPNIIAGEEVVPELLQGRFTPEVVVREALTLLDNEARRRQVRARLRQVVARLGTPGAPGRAADIVAAMLARPNPSHR